MQLADGHGTSAMAEPAGTRFSCGAGALVVRRTQRQLPPLARPCRSECTQGGVEPLATIGGAFNKISYQRPLHPGALSGEWRPEHVPHAHDRCLRAGSLCHGCEQRTALVREQVQPLVQGYHQLRVQGHHLLHRRGCRLRLRALPPAIQRGDMVGNRRCRGVQPAVSARFGHAAYCGLRNEHRTRRLCFTNRHGMDEYRQTGVASAAH